MVRTEEVVEGRVVLLAERLIDFEAFLELDGPQAALELVDGVLVERPMVQLEHEKLFAWLFPILRIITEERGLGVVFGSRTPVEIHAYRGRLPDLLFVRQERLSIVQEKAIYGAPDLVIEIVSPNDRLSDLRALETDYRNIGVAEIVFVDQGKQTVRALRVQADGTYQEELLTTAGALRFTTLDGLTLPADWLLREPRPPLYETITRLLGRSETP